ncbi:MAG: S8 family serine peptidase [Caldilineaceae bacterium]
MAALVFCLISPIPLHAAQTVQTTPPISPDAKISPVLAQMLNEAATDSMTTVIVTLADPLDPQRIAQSRRAEGPDALLRTMQTKTSAAQAPLLASLTQAEDGTVQSVIPFWIFNGLSITATPQVIRSLATRADVQSIGPDVIDLRLSPDAIDPEPSPNLTQIGAQELWRLGYTGQGVVVASLDTGVDVDHPDLQRNWRGGDNSWFDPYNQHPDRPVDFNGHGTWTMGAIVGGSHSGSNLGAAPGTQWIAGRVFNDADKATVTAVHLAFQWLLDPDGDPTTDDAPDVVNSSWSIDVVGCNLTFEPDLLALRAAGILPIFAAGNYGPQAGTSSSPANNPSALAVGAVNGQDRIYSESSRGPSACADPIFPHLSAPGVAILTAERGGGYFRATGTSMAAPHVTASVALLLSAFPDLTVEQIQNALLSSAVDLGVSGADMTFGYGRLDVGAAFDWLVNHAGEIQLVPSTLTLPILVTTVDDVVAADGLCSLREAVVAANDDMAYNGCTAGSGADHIRFAASLPQPPTIVLTTTGTAEDAALSGDLDLLSTLTIDGGDGVIIDGNDADRVFDIHAGAHITITHVTVRHGRGETGDSGGGLRVRGRLTLGDSIVSGNWGGGVANLSGITVITNTQIVSNVMGYGVSNQIQGGLTVDGGRVAHNERGGVYNALSTATLIGVEIAHNSGSGVHNEGASIARVTLSASTVMSNSAESGAGVFNQGVGAQMGIVRTRFSGNVASSSGGGIFNNGTLSVASSTLDHNRARAGGGLHHFGGTLTLTNDTFSTNRAADNGGSLYAGGAATIRNVTFLGGEAGGDGGNLFIDEGAVSIGAAIVSDAASGDNCVNSGGAVTSLGYNLESTDTCGFNAAGDLPNHDAKLGPLADNGGDTPTHLPADDSPALDQIPAGVNRCGESINSDQRGVTRPQGTGCDIGAVEMAVPQWAVFAPLVMR